MSDPVDHLSKALDLVDLVNEGLTVWPDGLKAICDACNRPYVTYMAKKKIDYGANTDLVDNKLCMALADHLMTVKRDTKASFVSWRIHPKYMTTNENQIDVGQGFMEERVIIDLDNIVRILRCRLIFANAAVPFPKGDMG